MFVVELSWNEVESVFMVQCVMAASAVATPVASLGERARRVDWMEDAVEVTSWEDCSWDGPEDVTEMDITALSARWKSSDCPWTVTMRGAIVVVVGFVVSGFDRETSDSMTEIDISAMYHDASCILYAR